MNQILRWLRLQSAPRMLPRDASFDSDDRQRQWHIAFGVSASRHDQGLVIFHEPTGRIFACNHLGAEIWELLSNGLGTEEIARQLGDLHDLPLDRFVPDVVRFVASLKQQELITGEEIL